MIERLIKKKIIIICGHYGTGKTNIAVNLTINIKKAKNIVYTLVDLDTVNPYFRSADNIDSLRECGIDFIVPQFANTNVDIPSVPPEIYSIFVDDDNKGAIIDVGGDDAGATVLGMFSDKIADTDYEMIYVINKYRNMISDIEDAKSLANSIENNSKLKITSIINNSNIGELTTKENVLDSFDYADRVSKSLGVPIIGTSVKSEIAVKMADNIREKHGIFEIKDYTRKVFL